MANKQLQSEKPRMGVLMLQAEVARLMGLSRERVRQLTLLGELPIWEETYGGRALFHLRDVEKLIAEREASR